MRTRIPPGQKSRMPWKEICVAVPATSRSSRQLRRRPRSGRSGGRPFMAAVADQPSIGGAIPKPDAWLKATGTATYAGDVRLPGMLEAKVLRSPHPHARIVSIDTSAAEALPGVYAVVTGADCTETRIGRFIRDRYALVKDRARYVGEPVAAVAAVDEETAERAIQLIEV